MERILSVTGLSIERDQMILHDINWQVNRGEQWVILGPNGCGKTSLLNAFMGYLMPTTGEVMVLGQIYGEEDWSELRKQIGMVSASIGQRIEPTESVLEVVAGGRYAMINYWGTLRRRDKSDAGALLEQLGCAYLLKRDWRFLSQGERQRVLIARALMANPAVLFLDEPCAGLDPLAREHFLDFVETLPASASSPTLVLITHHVEEIRPLFSHVLLLKRGTVFASGEVRKVVNSSNLSQLFDAPITLSKSKKRWSLSFAD